MFRRLSWHTSVVFLMLSATLVASKVSEPRVPEFLAQPLDTIPWNIAGFSGTANPPLSDGVLGRLLADSYLVRTYRKGEMPIDVFIGFYARQRAGESMHSPKHCLPGAGWEIWNYGSTEIPVDGRNVPINKYSISHSGERRLVLYWYQSKTRIIASEYMGKLLLARDALLQNSTAGSIVRIIVPDQQGALEQARSFAAALVPYIKRCFGAYPGVIGLPEFPRHDLNPPS
jgi:EpsI family protein